MNINNVHINPVCIYIYPVSIYICIIRIQPHIIMQETLKFFEKMGHLSFVPKEIDLHGSSSQMKLSDLHSLLHKEKLCK
jgi:hypothetical protein